MIGEKIFHYTITEKLGAGGMGVVYKAEDGRLDRNVALKFLPEDLASDPTALQRFQREAKAASALNHPGICTVFAIEQHESHHFIVMELLEGETLADRMHQEPISVKEVLSVGVQIADALESAHAKGIVHRDLKPANIFINERDQVKILDFGLAKVEITRKGEGGSQVETAVRKDQLTQAGSTLGTVAYMSPEQTRGQPTDARTDLFSVGTVLYQMATGVLPFKGETSAVVTEAILNRAPIQVTQINPNLPGELGRIIGKALEKDRNFRYQTAMELKTDLMRLQRDLDSGGRPAVESSDPSREAQGEKSIAVLYLENLSGAKEDEYLRDGITEDIITELSKIKGLRIFSRPTVLTYRDRQVTPVQIGRELGAAF
ncbi:MAG: serine/threonine-protein kinase, partial [Thermoanaerobaculia bacterium]|nr:serine/threonine-protein kinase [Thermoanaerobaculia bacterium]